MSAKVVVGMSGGVDSSVAASLLKDDGYEVIGVSINLLTCNRPIDRSCCSTRDREDAREVCDELGIKHLTVDSRKIFKETVIDPFVQEYLLGRTPSPCILCNEFVKFRALIEEADKIGAEYIATGHYARKIFECSSLRASLCNLTGLPRRYAPRNDSNLGKYKLISAIDKIKDQTYFLFRFSQAELARTLFPLGEFTKVQVKKIAADKKLKVHIKPESQEVCFVPEDDYISFVEENSEGKIKGPGNFVDLKGNVVGRHKGIHAYTIGQRRGLGFGVGKRQYVIGINKDKNEVVLGSDDDLMKTSMEIMDVNWISGVFPEVQEVTVKIRSTHKGTLAKIKSKDNNSVLVDFETPVRAVAPGQAAVFYDGEEVLGGGWIL